MSVIDYKKIKTNIVAFDFFDTIVHRDCNPEIILFKWAKEVSCYLRFSISSSVIYQIRKKIETGKSAGVPERSLRFSFIRFEVCEIIRSLEEFHK